MANSQISDPYNEHPASSSSSQFLESSIKTSVVKHHNFFFYTGLMALGDLHKKILKTSKSRQDVTE